MRKFFIRTLSFVLCVFIVFGAACSGCSCNPEEEAELVPVDSLVKDGKSAYKIVLPQNATDIERTASEEIVELLGEATGVTYEVITDAGLSFSESDHYISLGKNTLSEQAQIVANEEELGEEGFVIKVKGNSVFCLGAHEYGTLYAAYRFLHETVNFEQYYLNTYSLDKNVTELTLYNYDITDKPDIEYRNTDYYWLSNDSTTYRRMRLRPKNTYFTKLNGKMSNHNAFKYVPIDECKEAHPKWYADDDSQLCYLAHGDEEERAALIKHVGDQVIQQLEEQPETIYVHMGQTDNLNWCTCEQCSASLSKYGANSATFLTFCNGLREYIDNYYEQNNIQREYYITFFAYYATNSAPARYNETTGKYEPIDGLKCADGVYVFWGDTFVNYQQSIYHESNSQYYKSLLGWSALSEKMLIWTYDTDYYYVLAPFESFNSMQDFYQCVSELGACYVHLNGHLQWGASTGWSSLKLYLYSKLTWDVNADMEQLIKNYFDNVYGIVSDDMYEAFNELRLHCELIKQTSGYGGLNAVYQNLVQEKFWPDATLKQWVSIFDSAIEKIEVYKDDAKEYERLYKMIALERISYNYLRLELYSAYMTDEEALSLKLQTKSDIKLLGMTHTSTTGTVEELFAKWGV